MNSDFSTMTGSARILDLPTFDLKSCDFGYGLGTNTLYCAPV